MIAPYRLTPVAPEVALLLDDGTVVDEHGAILELDRLDRGVRVWCSWDTCATLLRAGRGEALCWDGEPIRWRHRRFEDGWQHRHTDVTVLRLPFPVNHRAALRGVAAWRDWLARYGATPRSLGSSGWSLLRATLERRLWTSVGVAPPIRWTLGGRQQLGAGGPGSYRGELEHWDLEAAYARTLGETVYGGAWRQVDGRHEPAWWARGGRLVFVRARVRVPAGLEFGPLPRRPRRRPDGWNSVLFPVEYPVGVTLQGCWTWPELEAAVDAGCSIRRLLGCWAHLGGRQVFLPWWEAVQAGRRQDGFAGLLAKATGNATWGQFALGDGRRFVLRWERGKRVLRPLPGFPARPGAPDLAESITGRVRGDLYGLLRAAGPGLLSAHTDGGWTASEGLQTALGGTWRMKDRATRVDLLGPQTLRYWRPGRADPFYRVSGVPPAAAAEAFEEAWIAWSH